MAKMFYTKKYKKKILSKIIICITIFLIVLFVYRINDFLSPTKKIDAEVLVVEGWLPDYMLESAVKEFYKGKYKYVVTTGVIIKSKKNSTNKSYVERAAERLIEIGISADKVVAVQSQINRFHRTYYSAIGLKTWLMKNDSEIKRINLFTGAVHGRKSHNIFKRVFKENVKIGIISCETRLYNPKYWFLSFTGIKYTIKYTIEYLYSIVWPFCLLK